MELLQGDQPVFMCAPMVRYSKLPFRNLVRKYGCHLAFTPMIMADSFHKSQKARDNEFSTNADDRPLIVQFASSTATDLALASELVSRWCDGVDLNCGCPQRWARQQGIGVCLIKRPELVADMVRQLRARISDPDFSVSVKIRLHHDVRETVEYCRRMESAGVSFITVHGRTAEQRRDPVDLVAIREVVDSLQIPVVANGDVRRLQDAHDVVQATGARGVMSARGLLYNPALFSTDAAETPLCCVRDWIALAAGTGASFSCFHHHLIYMLEGSVPRPLRRTFNTLPSVPAILHFLRQQLQLPV